MLLAGAVPAAPSHAALVYQASGRRVIAAQDDGSEARVLAHGVRPTVSPNGRWVTYVSSDQRRVMLMPFAGGQRRVIASGRHNYNVADGVASTSWSHDSKLVATTEVGWRLVVRDVTTGVSRTRKVFDNAANLGAPSFSPSGRRVAYSQFLDVSGYIGWVTTRGPRRSATLTFGRGGPRMGTNPVWGPRGIALWEFDGDRYDVGSLSSFVFVSDSTGRHGDRLPGSSDCLPLAWVGPDVLFAARIDSSNREQPVYLAINRQPVAALPDSYSRIAALAADHQSFIALDGDAIVRVNLTTGARQLLGHGTNPSWSG
jgi:hypothetical protein